EPCILAHDDEVACHADLLQGTVIARPFATRNARMESCRHSHHSAQTTGQCSLGQNLPPVACLAPPVCPAIAAAAARADAVACLLADVPPFVGSASDRSHPITANSVSVMVESSRVGSFRPFTATAMPMQALRTSCKLSPSTVFAIAYLLHSSLAGES